MSSSQLITHTYLAQREAVAEGAFFHTHLIQHSATCTFHSNRLKVLHHLLTILQLTWAQKPPQTEESACFTWTRSVLCTKIRDLPEQTSDGFSNIYLWIFTRGEKFGGENLQKCWPALFNSLHLIVCPLIWLQTTVEIFFCVNVILLRGTRRRRITFVCFLVQGVPCVFNWLLILPQKLWPTQLTPSLVYVNHVHVFVEPNRMLPPLKLVEVVVMAAAATAKK